MKLKTGFSTIIVALLTLVGTFCFTYAREGFTELRRWDLRMIEEAPTWRYLLVNYGYAGHMKYWPKRKVALQTVVNKYPDSRWVDDAALILACGEASFEWDTTGAIAALREVMEKYPEEQTVVSGWTPDGGCGFDDTWLMWAPSLALLNPDGSIRWSRPFDKYGGPSWQELEALAYFNHLENYPKLTVDVSQRIIAQMLLRQGDCTGAITELEAIVARHPKLTAINTMDRKAATNSDGYLIGHEPPRNTSPVWRPEYSAYLTLMDYYQVQGQNDKAVATGLALANACSNDGWYWERINRRVGDMCAKNGRWTEAEKQYRIALQGCRQFVADRIARGKALDKEGTCNPDFVSWEHQILEVEGWSLSIAELEKLVQNAQKKH